MTIRAVIFDIGGVLFQQPDRTAHRRWEDKLGLAQDQLGRTIWTMPISAQAEIGMASEEDVWAAVADRFQLSSIELAALRDDFFAGGVWNDRLLAYAQTLRANFAIGIISNAWPTARTAVHQHVNDVLFDEVIFSAEVGLAKPDRRIYQLALDRLHVPPAAAIFVDDVSVNVEAAQAIGIKGIRFCSTDQTMADIEGCLKH